MFGKKLLFGLLGVVAAIVAIVGIFLPGIPTVPPLIIALWALGKSSMRLRKKLEALPLLKTALIEADRFERERSIPRRIKIVAQVSAWISVVVVALVTRNSIAVSCLVIVATACSLCMHWMPTAERGTQSINQAEPVIE